MKLFSKKNIRIVPNQDFLHDRTRFKKGVAYKVPINLARYFDRNGWLEGSEPGAPNPNLDIHDSTLGHWGG